MTLDIRGGIKNTKLSSNPYIVFEELISNAIDSYLIRRNSEATAPRMLIEIEVEFSAADLVDDLEELTVSCKDNGCGFGEDQLNAFLTKDTSYKDDLPIPGIGKCKGAGRIQLFHHFSALSIDSTFRQADNLVRREMHYLEPQKQIGVDDFAISTKHPEQVGTLVRVHQLKESVRSRIVHGGELSGLFSATTLKKEMLVAFLQRLIGLDNWLGDFEISFTTRHWKFPSQSEFLRRDDLPVVTVERIVEAEECDPFTGQNLGTKQVFRISHYRLDVTRYGLPKNAIALCAKSSPVKDITQRYLRTKMEQTNSVGGFHHIVLIEGDYLDGHVNEQRDDFDKIPSDLPSNDMFSSEKLSYSAIYDAIDPVIHELVGPSDWNRDEVIKEISTQFGVSAAMLQDTSTRIHYGESAQTVTERVLKKYQERVVKETGEIFNLKEEILKAEPDSAGFRENINKLSWIYTSSLKNIDMVNLSQLVVRRAAIVEILSLACGKSLAIQAATSETRRKDESIIHSIFFPMRKDNTEVSDHDIWLLSEEYQYYDYIASDVALSKIAWDGDNMLFEVDIDQDFRDLLAKRTDDNSRKRPDIAIFNKEGSAIIIEFKAPGVSMDDHIGDLSEYAHLLAAKSGGKLKKFYGYLIGDTVNSLRLTGWTRFPTGKGWFQSNTLTDPESGYQLGESYFEILHYSDVIDRAKKRIAVFQEKLNFSLDQDSR
jgi:hypothetical protein